MSGLKRTDAVSLGDAMRICIQECNMTDRLAEEQAAEAWPKVIGLDFARMSPRPTVYRGVMIVRLAAAPLRHEFNMQRASLVRAINRIVGKEVIKDIRFIAL